MLSQDQLQTPFMAQLCEMADRIVHGERLAQWREPVDELSPEYRDRICYWMRRHGLTEASGGPAFFNMVPLVPSARAAEHLCHIAAEELAHGRMNLEPLRDFGYDPDAIFQSRWSMTPEDEWEQLRLGPSRHENRSGGFETVIAFTMLIDPMGLLVVCERVLSNYGPWARANAAVFQDEKGHAAFWERWGMDYIDSDEGHSKVQQAIDGMFASTLGGLGRPAAEDSDFQRDHALGIRTHDGDEYRRILKGMLRPTFDTLGFNLPEVEPTYESILL